VPPVPKSASGNGSSYLSGTRLFRIMLSVHMPAFKEAPPTTCTLHSICETALEIGFEGCLLVARSINTCTRTPFVDKSYFAAARVDMPGVGLRTVALLPSASSRFEVEVCPATPSQAQDGVEMCFSGTSR